MPNLITKPIEAAGGQTVADLAEKAGLSQKDVMAEAAKYPDLNPDALIGGLLNQRQNDANLPRPVLNPAPPTPGTPSAPTAPGTPDPNTIYDPTIGEYRSRRPSDSLTPRPVTNSANDYSTAAPRSETDIRNEEMKKAQAMIDATDALFQSQLGDIKNRGKESLAQTSSIAVGAGLAGSPFQQTQETKTQAYTAKEEQAARSERAAQVASIMAAAEGRATDQYDKAIQRFQQERAFNVSERDKANADMKAKTEASKTATLESIKNMAKSGLSIDELNPGDLQKMLDASGMSEFEARAIWSTNSPQANGQITTMNGQLVNSYFDPITKKPVVSVIPLPPELVAAAKNEADIKTVVTDEGIFAYNSKDANPKFTKVGGKPPEAGKQFEEAKFIQDLRKEFNGTETVKNFNTVDSAYGKMLNVLEDAKSGNVAPARDAMIIVFNKMLDPGSVVREGEFSRTEQGQDLKTRAEEYLKKLTTSGAGIDPAIIQQMSDVAGDIYRAELERYNSEADFYKETAVSAGVDPNRVIREFAPRAVTADVNPQPQKFTQDDIDYMKSQGKTDEEIKAMQQGFNSDLSTSQNGSKIVGVNIGDKTVKISSSIADPLMAADQDFFNATGKHLAINEGVRSTARQAELYKAYKSGKGGRAAPPGKSFHETGKAIDVSNWKEAAPYLHKYGFKNDLADDRNHFSQGEFS